MGAPTSSRREFLRGIALNKGTADPCIPTTPAPTPSIGWHIANRLMCGPAPGDVAKYDAFGLSAFLDEQLNPDSIDDSEADAVLASHPLGTYDETWQQLYDRRSAGYPDSRYPLWQTRDRMYLKMLHSKRQLFERVVYFWHEHFSVKGDLTYVTQLFPKWDQVMRTHALGNFRALLGETAKHPCMLYYLDNYVNTVGGPNENYARELFELHTLGAMSYRPDIKDDITCNASNDVDGDGVRDFYIDNDVYEAARAFTGWTFDRNSDSSTRGQFVYDGADHDRFNKFYMCQYIPPDGDALEDGESVLDTLAYHPGTARHICSKLIRRFVSDDPPSDLVESAAQVFLANKEANDQIAVVLRHIIESDQFLSARAVKFKRPLEWIISMMRALEVPFKNDDDFSFIGRFRDMGHYTFHWGPPDGPPDEAGAWSNSQGFLRRWNMMLQMSSGWFNGGGWRFFVDSWLPSEAASAQDIVDQVVARVLQRPLSGPTYQALLDAVAEGRNVTSPIPVEDREELAFELAALCVLTPEFQWM